MIVRMMICITETTILKELNLLPSEVLVPDICYYYLLWVVAEIDNKKVI